MFYNSTFLPTIYDPWRKSSSHINLHASTMAEKSSAAAVSIGVGASSNNNGPAVLGQEGDGASSKNDEGTLVLGQKGDGLSGKNEMGGATAAATLEASTDLAVGLPAAPVQGQEWGGASGKIDMGIDLGGIKEASADSATQQRVNPGDGGINSPPVIGLKVDEANSAPAGTAAAAFGVGQEGDGQNDMGSTTAAAAFGVNKEASTDGGEINSATRLKLFQQIIFGQLPSTQELVTPKEKGHLHNPFLASTVSKDCSQLSNEALRQANCPPSAGIQTSSIKPRLLTSGDAPNPQLELMLKAMSDGNQAAAIDLMKSIMENTCGSSLKNNNDESKTNDFCINRQHSIIGDSLDLVIPCPPPSVLGSSINSTRHKIDVPLDFLPMKETEMTRDHAVKMYHLAPGFLHKGFDPKTDFRHYDQFLAKLKELRSHLIASLYQHIISHWKFFLSFLNLPQPNAEKTKKFKAWTDYVVDVAMPTGLDQKKLSGKTEAFQAIAVLMWGTSNEPTIDTVIKEAEDYFGIRTPRSRSRDHHIVAILNEKIKSFRKKFQRRLTSKLNTKFYHSESSTKKHFGEEEYYERPVRIFMGSSRIVGCFYISKNPPKKSYQTECDDSDCKPTKNDLMESDLEVPYNMFEKESSVPRTRSEKSNMTNAKATNDTNQKKTTKVVKRNKKEKKKPSIEPEAEVNECEFIFYICCIALNLLTLHFSKMS